MKLENIVDWRNGRVHVILAPFRLIADLCIEASEMIFGGFGERAAGRVRPAERPV